MKLTESQPLLGGNSDRRSFLRQAVGLGAGAVALAAAPRMARAVDNPALAQDLDVLTLALNLEYLEAEFYSYAVSGVGIDSFGVGTSGTTAAGNTTIKASPTVPFVTDAIRQYASEIATDERNHVRALRALFRSAGVTPPAKPAIDLFNSFNNLAQAAGIGTSFDPFADEISFLIGAFIFEDVGVTAYRGGSRLLTDPTYLGNAAGILAVEAFHASIVRVAVLENGDLGIRPIIQKISDLRDSLDGSTNDDQALGDPKGRRNYLNIAPTNGNAQVYGRNKEQVLSIVYGKAGASSGLFFPNGINP